MFFGIVLNRMRAPVRVGAGRKESEDKKMRAAKSIVRLAPKWIASYRILRERNGFGVLESVRLGLWLAQH